MTPSGTPTPAPIAALWLLEGRGLDEGEPLEEIAELGVLMFVDDNDPVVLGVITGVNALVVELVAVVADEVLRVVEVVELVTPMVVRTDGVPTKCSGRVRPAVAEQSQSPSEPSCAWQQ